MLWSLEGIWVVWTSCSPDALVAADGASLGVVVVSLITNDAAPVLPVPEILVSWGPAPAFLGSMDNSGEEHMPRAGNNLSPPFTPTPGGVLSWTGSA